MVRDALTPEKLGKLTPEEAAAYFIMRRAEELTASEQRLLTDWLARDAAHQRALENADRAWESFAEPEGNEILAAMRARALAAAPRMAPTWWPAAAAALVLLAVGAMLFLPVLRGINSQQRAPASIAAIQYSSAHGAVKDFQLPDGSTMTLDADSAAVGRFSTNARSVQLQRGRAFFAVSPDRARPFSVNAGGHSILAVGTRFDVNLVAVGLTVTLLDGNVDIGLLNVSTPSVTLQPGQQYVLRSGNAVIRTLSADAENAVAWRVGLINFDDQPLAEVVEVMNRYSQAKIVVDYPAVATMRVSGQFRAGDAERFVATLVELHKLRAIHKGNEIQLLPGP